MFWGLAFKDVNSADNTVEFVRTASLVEAVHVPFEIVHLSVAIFDDEIPVTVVVGELGSVIIGVVVLLWLKTVHVPVPVDAVLAAIVKDDDDIV